MQNLVKRVSTTAVVGGALLAAGGFGLAHAAPPAQSVVADGKVNVTVTAGGQQVGAIQDVSLTSAQALVASACPDAGITSEAFQALDVNDTPVPGTCAGVDGGLSFTFAQNSPGQSENAPAQNLPSATPEPATTSASPTTAR
jgi:hypothetical protein